MPSSDYPTRAPLKLSPGSYPAFTLDDMRAHLLSAPVCSVGPTLSGELPTIETLEFVTSGELRARIETSIGLPDDALICYAVLRGPFRATQISLPPASGGRSPIAGAVGEVYDARTGRLLVSHGVPHTRDH